MKGLGKQEKLLWGIMMNNVKLGRPIGVREGHGKGSNRKKVQIGLYPDDIKILNKLENIMDISKSGVVRYALEKVYADKS